MEEYINMFNLSKIDLEKKILGCGDGPASFNAEMTKLNRNVISVDPIYKLSRDEIKAHFKKINMDLTLKYIDPSYIIRSIPANAHDSAFCLLFGQNAVHAGMAGRTNTVVGYWKREFTHVPIRLAVSERKCIDPDGRLWNHVLAATGQPRDMT